MVQGEPWRGIVCNPRHSSFCTFALDQPDILEICDPRADPRVAHLPVVSDAPFIRYYIGVPLRWQGVSMSVLSASWIRGNAIPLRRSESLSYRAGATGVGGTGGTGGPDPDGRTRMIDVVLCLTQEHDLNLVALALVICLTGSLATVQLFSRVQASLAIAVSAGSFWERWARGRWSGPRISWR